MTNYTSDATFTKLMNLIFESEGGFSNHKRDTGGATMYGISWNNNADYLKTHFGMSFPQDIKNLTKEQAKQTYYDRYWIPSGGDGITDIDLAYIHFDAAVNCGTGQAAKFIRRLSKNPKHFDGRGGKNRTLFMQLFLEYTAQRLTYYTHCKDRDVFLEGWINRMSKVILDSIGLD